MQQTTQSVSKILALIAFTSLFAGMWANDRPVNAMAMKTMPIERGLVDRDAGQEPEWYPVATSLLDSEQQPDTDFEAAAVIEVSLPFSSRTFAVDSTELLISKEQLQSHLDQLPLGMSAGNYRLVDELGGVGWLRIRSDGETTAPESDQQNDSPRLFSTTVAGKQMRYLRIAVVIASSRTGTQQD